MPRLAPKLTALAALILLTLPACSSKSGPTAPTTTASPTGTSSPATGATTATTSPTATGSPTPTATATTNAPPTAGTQITIEKFLYSPVNLQAKPGATITVMNKDAVSHTVTAESTSGGIPFDTGTIKANASGTFTAPMTPGTYPYICTFHPQMHGVLTVSS